MQDRQRIVNLDFLRGLFIILALDEHFTYYMNMWYVEYFRDAAALRTTYSIHLPMIGKQLPADLFNYILGTIFIPWVSQIYLTMSAFNLAAKTPEKVKETLKSRLTLYGMLIVLFIFEVFLVSPDFGQSISIYPFILWMIVLGLISVLYSLFGMKSIWILLFFSLLRFIFPVDEWSDAFQEYMMTNIHPSFEYDARIEYFLTSGCLGFILGHCHYYVEKIKETKDYLFIGLGILMCAVFFLTGGYYLPSDWTNALSNEHETARTLLGCFFLWGAQMAVISFFLLLERKNIKINFPLFTWISMNSLLVFFFHRILLIKVVVPISTFLHTMFGKVHTAGSIEVWSYIFIVIFMVYLIKKFRFFDLLFAENRKV